MAVITKVDGITRRYTAAQEVASVITLIPGMYPGREIEILWQIEEEGGSALARLEHGERTIAAEEAID